ncbi:MAG: hypothetical protein EAZ50_08515 [Runella slithyformis]|nr:MAG: hypothetical protein EAZ50_08515 [Runella slithyformis]
MIVNGRAVEFSKQFLDELFAIQEYLSFYSKNYANFMSEVIDFAADTISPQPGTYLGGSPLQ